jgi:nicotinamidase-related amidase
MEQKSALLVMDMQMGILGTYPKTDELVANVSSAIVQARAKNIPVMYVVVGFRPGAPEVSPNNKMFSGMKEYMKNYSPEEFMKIHPSIAPQANDVVITKRRVSAFSGSDLEVILRAQGISHLILTGIATSGVVLSTTREAADKDYKITIISDCCADSDEEVQKVLMEKVLMRQAEMVRIEKWE